MFRILIQRGFKDQMNIGCDLRNFIKNNRRQDVIQRAADAQMENALTA